MGFTWDQIGQYILTFLGGAIAGGFTMAVRVNRNKTRTRTEINQNGNFVGGDLLAGGKNEGKQSRTK